MSLYVDLKDVGCFTKEMIEILPLTVLTGVNGSGKTEILKAILNQSDNVLHYKEKEIHMLDEEIQAKKGNILLFEQPESGLHPELQLMLADTLLTYVNTGATVVVETHSDHIVNRLTRRCLENEQVMDMARIYFLEREYQKQTEIKRIRIDPMNGIVNAPKGFFLEYALEMRGILNAAMSNYRKTIGVCRSHDKI